MCVCVCLVHFDYDAVISLPSHDNCDHENCIVFILKATFRFGHSKQKKRQFDKLSILRTLYLNVSDKTCRIHNGF